MRRFLCLPFAAALLLSGPALAQEKAITIARQVSTTAMDPGFLREAATIVDNVFDTRAPRALRGAPPIVDHVFDTLVLRDKGMQLAPGLATSWSALDDSTWEFKLRS